jgi:tetratricopeptide (TPR) repeat protein
MDAVEPKEVSVGSQGDDDAGDNEDKGIIEENEEEEDDENEESEATKGEPADEPLLPSLDGVPVKSYNDPSMTLSLWVTWIIPLIFIAIFSRKVVDTTIPTIPVDETPHRPTAQLKLQRKIDQERRSQKQPTLGSPSSAPISDLLAAKNWPTSYTEILETIYRRRRPINEFPGGIYAQLSKIKKSVRQGQKQNKTEVVVDMTGEAVASETPAQSQPRNNARSGRKIRTKGRETDPTRARYLESIDELRTRIRQDPSNAFLSIALADAMRMYDMQFHEGGTFEQESIALYDTILAKVEQTRQDALSSGLPTDQSSNPAVRTVNDEVMLDYPQKSLDGLLCALYTAQGKTLFMANMFERAYEAYSSCLNDVYDNYLDAMNARGSTSIVLGQYAEASRDFLGVIRHEAQSSGPFFFIEAFTGLARVLEAKEDVVPEGWDSVVDLVHEVIPMLEQHLTLASGEEKARVAGSLNRLHHVLFTYHDSKTKRYPEAFDHLTQGFAHKMSVLAPWVAGSEQAKIVQTRNIFQCGFWPDGTGSRTRIPIFIIGFVRSGSTLLERILDAHPLIAGTGENSVFNGRLPDIRDQIVAASTGDSEEDMIETSRRLANEVVEEMQQRWNHLQASTRKGGVDDGEASLKPKRLADKMLTNYYNVGFIQLLYPNALILHVAREPMDSVFSAFKHEFPPGSLDYTSDYVGVSDLYHAYRDVMDHWDAALPGRITHIRYEDMVKDFENVARAVIKATGLEWDDSVLEFHKKKHAVNTLSSTQVRKGVYTSSLHSWKRYEKELQPLVKLLGDRMAYNLKTTIPGYLAKEPTEEE